MGNTPLHLAVNNEQHKTVHFMIKELNVNLRIFSKVCGINTLLCICIAGGADYCSECVVNKKGRHTLAMRNYLKEID